jgi:predicted transcriptional regulator of viral defense system
VLVGNGELFNESDGATDRELAAVANRQHGLITREQLHALGLTHNAIAYRIRIGRLHRIYRAVYAVGHVPVSPFARAKAAVLACGPSAALSHGSAATLWEITKEWRSPLEVTTRSKRAPRGIVAHESRTHTRRDITSHFGIRVTSPARTLLDLAAGPITDADLTRAVNDLRLSLHLKLGDLAELLDRTAPSRATNRLRPHADNDQNPTRSRFEDAFRPYAIAWGLPDYEANARVHGCEIDVWFPDHHVAVQLDGWHFHRDRRAFERDRSQDTRLLGRLDIPTVRITHEAADTTPDEVRECLLAILARREPAGTALTSSRRDRDAGPAPVHVHASLPVPARPDTLDHTRSRSKGAACAAGSHTPARRS